MDKEITLKEAEKIVDDMYQKRWIECGVENGNTIHMGNLDKLQYSELEKASILLLRTEIRLQSQLKKQKEVIDKVVECLNLWQIPECDKGTMREILFNTNKQNVLDILKEVSE